MIEKNNPEIDTDALMKKIQQEVSNRNRNKKRQFEKKKVILRLSRHKLDQPFKKNFERPYHIHDIIKYQNEEFIKAAFFAILHRKPESNEISFYKNLLSSGNVSKTEILGGIRYSKEGRIIGSKIHGLFLPFALLKISRIIYLGYLIRIGISLLRLPKIQQSIRRLEYHLFYELSTNKILQNETAEKLEKTANTIFQDIYCQKEILSNRQKEIENKVRDLEQQIKEMKKTFSST
jgi:O-antigen chain-terminating methyltransferase